MAESGGGTVYQLLGYPGTGKYTIACEIVRILRERGDVVALLDNHATANLLWQAVPPERRFERNVMDWLAKVRAVLLEAVEDIAAPDASLVFTNFVPPERPATVLDFHRDLARRRDSRLVAVALRCEPEEILRRVPNADRAERFKLVNTDIARASMEQPLNLPDWPELVDLDITGLTPTEAAERVLSL